MSLSGITESTQPMSKTTQEIANPTEQNEYKKRADRLREQLLEQCHDSDTVEIEDKLAYSVCQYTDPEERMATLHAMPRDDPAQEEAAKREFYALSRLIESRNKAETRFGSEGSAGLTLAILTDCALYDAPMLADEIREQAKRLTSNDQDAIKGLMAQQAILSHHVGQHIIQKSVNAPTTEARAVVVSHGVKILESSARTAERLSKIGQPKPGNVYANQANIAHNQVVQNSLSCLSVKVVDEPSDNVKSNNQLLEGKDDTRCNLSADWTQERKLKQSEAIRKWKPWENSTGPKSKSGKRRSANRSLKTGMASAAVIEARKTRMELQRLEVELMNKL